MATEAMWLKVGDVLGAWGVGPDCHDRAKRLIRFVLNELETVDPPCPICGADEPEFHEDAAYFAMHLLGCGVDLGPET